jgi:hypothetical protein
MKSMAQIVPVRPHPAEQWTLDKRIVKTLIANEAWQKQGNFSKYHLSNFFALFCF